MEQYHIKAKPEDIGGYCLLPGDPDRCDIIAQYFDEPRFVIQNREYRIFTGKLNGQDVSVCSTGIGGPSAAIAMTELAALGAHTFIRVGTCGGISTDVLTNDTVIAIGAIRFDGTSREYAPLEYPAVTNFDVTTAICAAAKEMGFPYHTGIVQCKDSFYGQHRPEEMPISGELLAKWEAWKRLGVLASEMETATLCVVADTLKVRFGSLCHVVWNQERKLLGLPNDESHDTERAIRIACRAVEILMEGK